MPEPPPVGLFTRYVLENPYPLAGALVALALALAWIGLREGVYGRTKLRAAGVSAVLAAAVLITGILVITPGEHGVEVTRRLVSHAVNAEVSPAMALFAPGASLSIGSTRNPGVGIDSIRRQLERLESQYRVRSNTITTLRGYGESRDAATVHLACRTEVENGWGPTPSQWVLRVERQDGGEWLITRITAITIAGRTPGERLW
jgi:hypothetical protein